MLLELIATVIAGIAGAGVMALIIRATGRRLPKWLVPAGAGAAMLATAISNEMAWFGNVTGNLPETMVVAQSFENKSFYRPWSYVVPYVDRFVALDQASVRTHPQQPDMRMADLYFFARWMPADTLSLLADCAGQRHAPLTGAVTFNADGSISGASWSKAAADDAFLALLCPKA